MTCIKMPSGILAPDNMRTIVAEMLDRLRDKSQKP